MSEQSNLAAFFIVDENDITGEGARGPYTMLEAESLLKVDEKIITRQKLTGMRSQNMRSQKPTTSPISNMSDAQTKMHREIRGWGIGLLVLGVFHILSSGFLSSEWGILLIGVGLASFFFREASMFVIYGVTLSWAAISNLLSGAGGWSAFSLLQAFFAFQTFRQFFRFRQVGADDEPENLHEKLRDATQSRSERFFPWAGCLFGAFSLVGIVVIFVLAILVAAINNPSATPRFVSFIEGLVVDMAILGVAFGLASLLSRYRYKALAAIGLIAGLLVLLIEIGFSFAG